MWCVKMKKSLAILTVFFFSISYIRSLYGESRIKKNGILYPPNIGGLSSEAVYMASNSCADNSFNGQEVRIATEPALMFSVNITSPGNSTVQFFDSAITTTGVRPLTPPIFMNSANAFNFDIGTSSGITVRASSGGATMGCYGVTYVVP